MKLEIAKLRAAVGFILVNKEKMFTGDGKGGFLSWPALKPLTFTKEDESADWSELP